MQVLFSWGDDNVKKKVPTVIENLVISVNVLVSLNTTLKCAIFKK